MEKIISVKQVSGASKYAADFSRMGEDYAFTRILPGENENYSLNNPIRINGLSIILLMEGEIKGEINLESFTLKPNSMMVIGGDSIFKINEADRSKINAYILFVSSQFLHDINFDLSTVNIRAVMEHRVPITPLTIDKANMLSQYLLLLHQNATENTHSIFSKNIARSLVSAVLYQMMQFHISRFESEHDERPRSRKLNYVQDFMKLVQMHHVSERSVAFYAEKLFISPKYLSLLIKDATGRSAAEWIDQFVIQEAKNMLRFSNKNIQQVAYALNFSNQSAFGKYFKHLTGMSPTEYQKS